MIIETPYKQNDTVSIKTNAGDEVVARFVEEDNNTITVQKPLALMATPQGGVGLGNFAFTIPQDTKLKLNKSGILFVHKTEPEMAKQYVNSTSSIQVV